jgi:hypothetical protein
MRLRLQVLDILELCVCVLREAEDELLPMVHHCWPALLRRLTDDDPLAVLRGFKVSPLPQEPPDPRSLPGDPYSAPR